MVIIKANEKGRVYINKFEIKKFVNEYIKENYSIIKYSSCDFNDDTMNIRVKKNGDFNISILNRLREELIQEFQNKYNYVILRVNIEVL